MFYMYITRTVNVADRKLHQVIKGSCGMYIRLFHSLKVYGPPGCLTRINIINRACQVRHKLVFTKKPQNFRSKYEKDGVDHGYELVYVNNMNKYYFWSQLMIYGMLIPSLFVSTCLIWSNRDDLRERVQKEEVDHPYFFALPGGLFAVLLILFTNTVCKRSIIRMYHHPERKTYIAITQKWNMIRENIEFTRQDCSPQSKSSLSTKYMLGGNVLIKDRKFLIRDTDFRQPVFYNEIMGWDRAKEDRSTRPYDDVKVFMRPKKKQ